MKIDLPESVQKILEKFTKTKYEIYIVGGAVRDILMGRIVHDWDFTTNATPEEILKIFPDGFCDNIFGTVGIKTEEFDKLLEITTYRTEYGYTDNRRPDKVFWGQSLEEDLSRRDFTINAMALGDKITDPFNGQNDIKNKLIRAVGDPDERFSEDALRMMRAVRIATELGFTIEEKTFEAIKKNSPLINKIAKERIKDELFKLITSPNAHDGMLLFKNSGLMSEILPELTKCFGVEQKSVGRHHIYDVGTHLLMALKFCKSEDVITKFATLIHDIGKPQTFKKLDTGVITFYNHEMVSTKIAVSIADRLRFSKKEKDKFITLVRWHQFTVDERQTDSAIRRFIRNVGKDYISDMLALRVGDRLGGGARETSWRLEEFKKRIDEVQKQPFSIKDLKINGRDVMEILRLRSGPRVGEILEKIFEEVVEKKIPNEKKALLKKLSSF
ncbi:MAG: CCA tRNA nucleotidyltransferase [Patescibacteria group bacterium]|mgnify:CR=1 FL=1